MHLNRSGNHGHSLSAEFIEDRRDALAMKPLNKNAFIFWPIVFILFAIAASIAVIYHVEKKRDAAPAKKEVSVEARSKDAKARAKDAKARAKRLRPVSAMPKKVVKGAALKEGLTGEDMSFGRGDASVMGKGSLTKAEARPVYTITSSPKRLKAKPAAEEISADGDSSFPEGDVPSEPRNLVIDARIDLTSALMSEPKKITPDDTAPTGPRAAGEEAQEAQENFNPTQERLLGGDPHLSVAQSGPPRARYNVRTGVGS